MAKIYLDNYRLIAARSLIFKSINKDANNYLNSVIKFKSGDFLPVKDIVEGKHKVYGGGGSTGNKHNNFNVKDYTIGIGRVGARCGCVFIIEPNSWVTDNALFAAEINGRYNLEFLLHWLNYNNLNQYANTSAQPVISLKRISGVLIPKISLEKQVEIAKLLDTVENGKKIVNDQWGISQLLESIQDIETLNIGFDTQSSYLTQLRQAILQEAIEGKLTADWRKENPVRKGDPDFDAEALLKKIKSDKEKLVTEGKIKKQKLLDPIKPEEVPFELPKGWVWTYILNFSKQYVDCPHDTPHYLDDGFPCLRAPDITESGLLLGKVRFVSPTEYKSRIKRLEPKENDLVYIREGGRLGIAGLINTKESVCLGQRVMLLRFVENISAKYALFFFNAPDTYRDIVGKTIGDASPHVNVRDIISHLIPVPPLAEQYTIVKRVERILENIDELEKQVSNRKEQTDMLMQSVLREAFEG